MKERFCPPLWIECGPLVSVGALPHPAVGAAAATSAADAIPPRPPATAVTATVSTRATAAAADPKVSLCRVMKRLLCHSAWTGTGRDPRRTSYPHDLPFLEGIAR